MSGESGVARGWDPSILLGGDGLLAATKPGYAERPEQLRLSRRVEECLRSRSLLLADAPTGTGKGLSYLAPAVAQAALEGRKTIVSTATLALQDQLLTEDLPPLVSAASRMDGASEDGVSYAVLKGRGNFFCDKRHQEFLLGGLIPDADLAAGISDWAAKIRTGDREDLTLAVPYPAWREVASDGDDCVRRVCAHAEDCHYYRHRDRAAKADIRIVNHALLLANAASGGVVFDTEDCHLVVDEAHRLEEIISDAFGSRLSRARVLYAARQAAKRAIAAHVPAQDAETAADLFFAELESVGAGPVGDPPKAYARLAESLGELETALANAPDEEANRLVGMVSRVRDDLEFFYAEPDEDHAYAVVTSGSGRRGRIPGTGVELRSWLIDATGAFRDGVLPLFSGGGVVLASATLATGASGSRSFGYVRRRLLGAVGSDTDSGDSRVEEYAGEEVFDYASRALIYAEPLAQPLAPPWVNSAENSVGNFGPAGIPSPGGSGGAGAFTRACVRRTEELVGLSRGRALVVLSTRRAVAAFRQSFDVPYEVRYQGDDSPGRLVRWLRASEGGVLVGTASFREGIDVPGAALSLLVMDKAPFAPPDDPVAVKLRERAGGRGFGEIFLPKAQMAMRQGAGRVMRRADDRGVIAVLDPRLSSSHWGRSILASLPPAPVTTDISDVGRFFEQA